MKEQSKFSRRNFIKGGVTLGATAAIAGVVGKGTTESVTKAIGKKELDEFPLKVDESRYKRFSIQKTAFGKKELSEGLPGLYNVIDNSKPGFTTIDNAFAKGAAATDNNKALTGIMYGLEGPTNEDKYQFASKEDATKAVKKAAKFYGASLVGITAYDKRWSFEPAYFDMATRTIYKDDDLPVQPKSVIVMAIEMDYEGMSTAPSTLELATTMLAYSNMAETSYKLATFLRSLGYKSFAAGNFFALSVPYGIAAGLGEIGRQGLLITYEYGPRVRICKVFTEMELNFDKPISFGATDFCKVCKKCAENCPSNSISFDDNMTWEGDTDTNTVGIEKYYVNTETCYTYWNTSGNDCGVCIASCPFNKPDFWHHKITTALTATPLKPFLNEMDDLFGYGDVFNEKTCNDFWGLENYTK